MNSRRDSQVKPYTFCKAIVLLEYRERHNNLNIISRLTSLYLMVGSIPTLVNRKVTTVTEDDSIAVLSFRIIADSAC